MLFIQELLAPEFIDLKAGLTGKKSRKIGFQVDFSQLIAPAGLNRCSA